MKQILGIITCVLLLGGQSQAKTANQPAAPKNHAAVQSAQNSPERIKVRNQGVPLGNILAMQPEEVAGIKFYIMSGMVSTIATMKEDRLKEVVLNSKGDAIHAYYDVPQAQLANVFSDLASSKVLAYDTQSKSALNILRSIVAAEGYEQMAKDELNALEKKLSHNFEYDFDYWRKDIKSLVESELVTRYYYQKGVAEYNLRNDKDFKLALKVLCDDARYHRLLAPKKH